MKNLQIKPSSIQDVQRYLVGLYGNKNESRSIDYLYSYLFRNASYLTRVIKRSGDPKDNFVKTVSWLFAIASRLNIDVEAAFLKKYPGVCPYCISNSCACSYTDKRPLLDTPEWKIADELNSKYLALKNTGFRLSLSGSVDHINKIYAANTHIWRAAGPSFQFYRILEELGEVHEAYTSFKAGKQSIDNVGSEIADCLAWIVSSWGICFPNIGFEGYFIDYYYHACPVCRAGPCSCEDYSDRGGMLAQINDLKAFKQKIEEIVRTTPEYTDDLTQSVNELDLAEGTMEARQAISAVKKAEYTLDKIRRGISNADASSKSILSLINSAKAIVHSMNWL